MTRIGSGAFIEDFKELEPIVEYELTDFGWRGWTSSGEMLEVRGMNGKIEVPDEVIVTQNGVPIGRRLVIKNH